MGDIKIEGLYAEKSDNCCDGCILFNRVNGKPFYDRAICSNIMLKTLGIDCMKENIVFKKKPKFKRLSDFDVLTPGDEVYIGNNIKAKFIVEFELDNNHNGHRVVVRCVATGTQSIQCTYLFSKLIN